MERFLLFVYGLAIGFISCIFIFGAYWEAEMIKAGCGCYDTKTGAFKTGEDCK
jgi:hypothetical protein